MTATMCRMESLEEFGKRIAAARTEQHLSVAKASDESGIARDTWKKIESGASTQDAKRRAVADYLGVPMEPKSERLTYGQLADLGPRLAGVDRQLDALWQRLDQLSNEVARLQRGGGHGDSGSPATTKDAEPGPRNQPGVTPLPGRKGASKLSSIENPFDVAPRAAEHRDEDGDLGERRNEDDF